MEQQIRELLEDTQRRIGYRELQRPPLAEAALGRGKDRKSCHEAVLEIDSELSMLRSFRTSLKTILGER